MREVRRARGLSRAQLRRYRGPLLVYSDAFSRAWDTAAPEALLRASGGTGTDLFGSQRVYDCSNKTEAYVNARGVLASSKRTVESGLHDVFCQKMRESETLLTLFGIDML